MDSNTPKEKWGPALEENRGERYKIPNMTIFDTITSGDPYQPHKNGIGNGTTVPGQTNDGFQYDDDNIKDKEAAMRF